MAHCHSHGSLLLRRLVCTRQACCLFAHVALLLLPLSLFLRVRAPSLSLAGFMIKAKAVRRGSLSFSLFVVASAACVYETGLLLVCACRTSAASVEPLPRGSRAVAFPRWLHVLSCLTWLIVRCCINSYVLASLTLIVIVARSTDHPTLIARLDAAARGGASSTDAENPRELHDVPHILRIRETRRAE